MATVRFRDLKIGQHFTFTGGSGFTNKAKKISSRCYVWAGKKSVETKKPGNWLTHKWRTGLMKSCVGTVDVAVNASGRHSAVKHRAGRGRGPKQLGRYKRSR